MNKPFKFRYVNEIVGGFVLLVLVLLLTGIVLAGKAQGWFEKRYTLYVKFPPQGSEGLQNAAEVRVLGTLAGVVDEIVVNPDNTLEGVLKVRGKFMRFIRADSEAVLKKKFAIAGDAYIEISQGKGRELPDYSYLPCRKDTEITQMLTDIVTKLQDSIFPVIDDTRTAIKTYTAVAEDIRSPTGYVQRILGNVNDIIVNVKKGEGMAGKVLSDPATAAELQKAMERITVALGEVNKILRDVKLVTTGLPALAEQTQATLAESQKLIEAIQQHWLIRGYVKPMPAGLLIGPEEIGR